MEWESTPADFKGLAFALGTTFCTGAETEFLAPTVNNDRACIQQPPSVDGACLPV